MRSRRGNANCLGCGSEWGRAAARPGWIVRLQCRSVSTTCMANVWQWVQDCYSSQLRWRPRRRLRLIGQDCSRHTAPAADRGSTIKSAPGQPRRRFPRRPSRLFGFSRWKGRLVRNPDRDARPASAGSRWHILIDVPARHHRRADRLDQPVLSSRLSSIGLRACGPICSRGYAPTFSRKHRRAGAEAAGKLPWNAPRTVPEMIVVPAGEFRDGIAGHRAGPSRQRRSRSTRSRSPDLLRWANTM